MLAIKHDEHHGCAMPPDAVPWVEEMPKFCVPKSFTARKQQGFEQPLGQNPKGGREHRMQTSSSNFGRKMDVLTEITRDGSSLFQWMVATTSPLLRHAVLFASKLTSWLVHACHLFIYYPIRVMVDPLILMTRVVNYNARLVVDFWLRLLLGTELDEILTNSFLRSHFLILVQWVRFMSLMCLGAMFLGIAVYYTFVRVIFTLTNVGNAPSRKNDQFSENLEGSDVNVVTTETTDSTDPEPTEGTIDDLTQDDDLDDVYPLSDRTSPISKAFRTRVSSMGTHPSTRTQITDIGTTTSSVFSNR